MVSTEMDGHLFRIREVFAASLVAIFQRPEVVGVAATSAVEEEFTSAGNKQESVTKQLFEIAKSDIGGEAPGLVVNIEDSQSEPWSLDVSSIPRFA
jgi:hypothetical protein